MLACDKPRVSIGLPVFNGEKYLEEALDSILTQTYTDFELIIFDNASTDNTPQICHAYEAKDRRIRYYRNDRNLGASKNFNRVFKLSSGEYFKWAAHDDVLVPEFLSRCVSLLDQDQSIVLCHSKTGRIDEYGEIIGRYNFKVRIDSPKAHERFRDLISERYDSWVSIFGLIRASSLKGTPLIGSYIGSDRNLLAEISLIGRIYETPEYLFYRRVHSEAYTGRNFKGFHKKLNWWTTVGRFNFPYVKICIEYFRSVRRVPLKFSERLLCYAEIVKWLLTEGWILISLDVVTNLIGGSSLSYKLGLLLHQIFKFFRVPLFEGDVRMDSGSAWTQSMKKRYWIRSGRVEKHRGKYGSKGGKHACTSNRS